MIPPMMLKPMIEILKVKLYDLDEKTIDIVGAEFELVISGTLILPKTETKPETAIDFSGVVQDGKGKIIVKRLVQTPEST